MLSFPDTHTCALGTGFTLSLIQREKEGGGGEGFISIRLKMTAICFFFLRVGVIAFIFTGCSFKIS